MFNIDYVFITFCCVSDISQILTTLSCIGTFLSGIGTILLILYYFTEYTLKEQSKKYYTLKRKLAKLKQLLFELSISVSPKNVTVLVDELTKQVFNTVKGVDKSTGIPIILLPNNRHELETWVTLVLEKSSINKSQTKYNNRIKCLMEDVYLLFPNYGILLASLFSLLLYYKRSKISTEQVITVLSSNEMIQCLKSTFLSPEDKDFSLIKINYMLTLCIMRTTVLSFNGQCAITEKSSEILNNLLGILLDSYIAFDNKYLEKLSQEQIKANRVHYEEYTYTEPLTLTQSFATLYAKIQKDFKLETRMQIVDYIKKFEESLIPLTADGNKR